ncbi:MULTISPECIES: phage holin family protein [unclassified Clostridium]|uniref:phage holin family protein n=1 Tax=unclassified Clostridium TaxID=2614128 RepID=UPI00029859CC|nr:MULTISPECIES: phage holin family protein [unclassified Clostridium]EKQ56694.1 MAG: membrane-bound serine protease (ClpP class) [Clostridium sp. Maddingley MBC34-26]
MVNDKEHSSRENFGSKSILGWLGRLAITVVILGITSFLTPGFSIRGLWSFILAAIVISILDYLVEAFMGTSASPFGRGIKGFIIAAIILYVTQFFVPAMSVSILGAILAALAIGILDAILPGKAM